jgi:predicted metal-dependent phosphoesterase TrpH
LRIDPHVHTSASFDCLVAPLDVAKRCSRLGLAPIFVTDHDTIAGAVEIKRSGVADVVIGEEIATRDGELIGLFLERELPPGLSARETVDRIHAQGGVVYLEHPFDTRRRALSQAALERIADDIDVVEVTNPRSTDRHNQQAADLALTLGVPAAGGSDAHAAGDIGSVHMEMSPFSDRESFLASLSDARIVNGRNRFLLMAEARLRW